MRGGSRIVVTAIALAVLPWAASADPLGLRPMLPAINMANGNFSTQCGFSHRLPDDPIVAPGKPGASHSHDFFGNRSTNAFSTHATLRGGSGSCHRPLDLSAYWVPTASQAGKQLKPNSAIAYYFAGNKPAASIKPFPAGLRMIAGNAKATNAQPSGVTSWSCTGSSARSSAPPLCRAGDWLRLHVRFADCWNGKDLDIIDHKSHMAYSGKRCPSTHPVGVPLLALTITYPTVGGPGIELSSGSVYTAHADFINAWDQDELTRLVKNCLNAGWGCGAR